MRFNDTQFRDAGLSPGGGTEVAVKKLDDIWEEVNPTLLKMDIEGAELSALQGAYKIIQQHLPLLCICLYHKNNDIIDIPRWLHDNFPQYYLYLRKHAHCYASELVLYALPPARVLTDNQQIASGG
jgi:hypothetical protein